VSWGQQPGQGEHTPDDNTQTGEGRPKDKLEAVSRLDRLTRRQTYAMVDIGGNVKSIAQVEARGKDTARGPLLPIFNISNYVDRGGNPADLLLFEHSSGH